MFLLLDADVGGGQRVAHDVAGELGRRGHEVGLLVRAPGPAVEDFLALGARVEFIDLGSLRRPQAVPRAGRIVADYDLLYSHTAVTGEILGDLAGRLARRPHVLHAHNEPHFSPDRLRGSVQRSLYRRFLHRRPFIAVASHVRSALIRAGIDPLCIRVVPNGVAIPETPAWPRSTGTAVVGMLGRLEPRKGFLTFLDAAECIRSRKIRFVVGGATGHMAEFESLVRERCRSLDVELILDPPDGEAFLRNLDVVVVPSWFEGAPLVPLEAMALGKPVIASDVPGMCELGSDGSIVLVPTRDAGALAAAILRLLDDPAERWRLAHAARSRAQRDFDVGRFSSLAADIVEDAIAGV